MDLLSNFINSLHEKINKRHELVLYIADVLCIEREPANRRLSGKVPFTVQEMEKLSQNLGISLDYLMQSKSAYALPTLKMKIPMSGYAIEDMIVHMELQTRKLESICIEPVELVTAFSSLPLDFIIPYPTLEKFMFYKWGYFHVGAEEYDDFSVWEMPERLKKANQQLLKVNEKIKTRLYIWNPVTVWSLAKEMKYFKSIHAISDQDINHIKTDLHSMFDDIENQAKMHTVQSDNKIEMYVSFINHGLNFYYFKTESNYHITFDSYFMSMENYKNLESDIYIQDWITSMKKVSTLISESGALARHLFFEEQHKYIDDI